MRASRTIRPVLESLPTRLSPSGFPVMTMPLSTPPGSTEPSSEVSYPTITVAERRYAVDFYA